MRQNIPKLDTNKRIRITGAARFINRLEETSLTVGLFIFENSCASDDHGSTGILLIVPDTRQYTVSLASAPWIYNLLTYYLINLLMSI